MCREGVMCKRAKRVLRSNCTGIGCMHGYIRIPSLRKTISAIDIIEARGILDRCCVYQAVHMFTRWEPSFVSSLPTLTQSVVSPSPRNGHVVQSTGILLFYSSLSKDLRKGLKRV